VINEVRSQQLGEDAHFRLIEKRGGTNILLSIVMFFGFIGVNFGIYAISDAIYSSEMSLGTKLMFNGGELYYTSSITRQEAEKLGEYLVRAQFFENRQHC
jgi:hypothetical protein